MKAPQPIPSKDELREQLSLLESKFTIAMIHSRKDGDPKHRIKVLDDFMQLIDSYIERQVARGKLEVIESVKAWADGVEVMYNELLSGELKKLREVEATTKQKEGDR